MTIRKHIHLSKLTFKNFKSFILFPLFVGTLEEEIEQVAGYILYPEIHEHIKKFSTPRGSPSHQKTLEKCMNLNKRLSLETKTLRQQLHSAEGEAAYFLSENESLKKEIEDFEKGELLYILKL